MYNTRFINKWWSELGKDIKLLIAMEDDVETFWSNLSEDIQHCIYIWTQTRLGKTNLEEDELQSLLTKLVCDLADIKLAAEYNISVDELDTLADEDCAYLEEYQDKFNKLYDDIENSLLSIFTS